MGHSNSSLRVLVSCVSVFLISGCVPHYDAQGVAVLRSLAESQKDLTRYVEGETRGYARLKNDIVNGMLRKGMREEEIIRRYGEPVFCRSVHGKTMERECIYRAPFGFFRSDTVFLYYAADAALGAWSVQRASPGE